MAATPILCEILGITLLGVFWYFGIGTMLWIVTLLIPIYLMVKVSNVPFPITRALVVVACMIAISIVWIKYVLSAKWFLDVLGWFIIVSQPVGFVIALLLVPICAFLFVWACTAILIGLDALLVTVGRKSQQARDDRAMESHSLLARDNDGDEDPSAAVTIPSTTAAIDVGNSTTDLPTTSSSMPTIQTISENIPLPPSRASTGLIVPATWGARLAALSERLETKSSKWAFHYRALPDAQLRRVQAIAFSLTNLFFTTMWYWCKYEPEGTKKAGWTDMFG